ncbi:MAG: glycosyltransferase family 2 protein [Gemmataceae bacterium]
MATTINSWQQALDKLGHKYEILLIDDGSTDATPTEAFALAAHHSVVRVVRHDSRRGIGASIHTGLNESSLANVVYAGPGYSPSDLKALVEMLDQADIVTGYRTSPVPNWLRSTGSVYRKLVLIAFGLTLEPRVSWRGWTEWRKVQRLRWLFGIRVTDPLCAFKVFRRTIMERIALQSDGEFVHAELLAKANFIGGLMAELPVAPPSRFGDAFGPGDYEAELRRVFRHAEFVRPTIAVVDAALPTGNA